MKLKLLLLFLFYIEFAYTSPITSRCNRKCKKISHKFTYGKRTSYTYYYESKNMLVMDDSDRFKPTVMKATVEIVKIDDCEMILQIRDARTENHVVEQDLLDDLMRYNFPFSFQDGKIDEICPSPDESTASVNIKRAMLSNLQNSMSNFNVRRENMEENGILGTCTTVYEVLENEDNKKILIKKSVDNKNCSKPDGGNLKVFTLDPSPVVLRQMPKESYYCMQTIEGGIILDVQCEEDNTYIVVMGSDIKIRTHGSIKFQLQKISRIDNLPSYKIRERQHLLYSHQPELFSNSAHKESLKILNSMCSKIHQTSTVDSEIPGLFSRLVQSLRKVKPTELEDIYNKLDTGKICASHWLMDLANDALPHIGHEGSIKIMSEKIQSGSVSKFQTALWVTSLAFVKNPTEEAVLAVMPLLDYDKAGKQGILAVTAMCNNYCKKNTSCDQSQAIERVIKSLRRYLKNQCRVYGSPASKQVITALKGFGNLGRSGSATKQILDCALQNSNKVPIRLAAIEAFRRTPCQNDVKQGLLNIFSGRREPVEVRIAAYLGAMKCADRELMRNIKRVYDSESLNQIKTFVYSHMKNILSSSSLEKENIREKEDTRQILSQFYSEKLKLDIRKDSQNIEWSDKFRQMNFGGEFQSNVIYSDDSFIPRSFMTNITSFAHGKIFNHMEIGGRVDGLDHWMKRLASPILQFDQMSFSEFMSFVINSAKETFESSQPLYKAITHKFRSNIDSLFDYIKKGMPSAAHGSFYFNYLGNELLWVSVDQSTDFNLEKVVDVVDLITEIARKQKTNTAHGLFLDTSFVYPSISGNALTIDIAGSLILGLKSEGKLDIRKAFVSPRNLHIEGKVDASVAGEINAVVGHKLLSKSSRVKYFVKVHGNSIIQGKLAIKDGHLFNMRIDFPKKRVDLLSISSNVIQIDEHGNELMDRPYTGVKDCLKTFRKVIGYDICMDMAFPGIKLSSKFPFLSLNIFNKPFEVGISLMKQDPTLNGFSLNIEIPNRNIYNTKIFKFEFDTPGSSVDRKYSVEVASGGFFKTIISPLIFHMYTPFCSIIVRGTIPLNKPEKTIFEFRIESVKKRNSTFLVGLENKDGHRVNVKVKDKEEPYLITGDVSFKRGKNSSFLFRLTSQKLSRPPVTISCHIVEEKDNQGYKLTTDLHTQFSFITFQYHGTTLISEKVISYDMDIKYKIPKSKKQSLASKFKIQNLSTNLFTNIVTRVDLKFSKFPQYNSHFNWNFKYKPKELLVKNELKIKSGRNMNMRFYVSQNSKMLENDYPRFNFKNVIVVLVPKYGINYEMVVFANHNDEARMFAIHADIKKDHRVCVKSNFTYSVISVEPLKMQIEFILEYPGRTIKYFDGLTEISPREFIGNSTLHWDGKQGLTFDYFYKIRSQPQSFKQDLDAVFTAPWLKFPIKHKGSVILTDDSVEIISDTNYKGKPAYKLDLRISPRKSNRLNFDIPNYFNTDVQFDTLDKETVLKFIINRQEIQRKILGMVIIKPKPNPTAKIHLKWDADRDPSAKLMIETEMQTSGINKQRIFFNKFEYANYIRINSKFNVSDNAVDGPHDLQLHIKHEKSFSIHLHHEIQGDTMINSELVTDFDFKQRFRAFVIKKATSEKARLKESYDVGISSSNLKWNNTGVSFILEKDFLHLINVKTELKVYTTYNKKYFLKAELGLDTRRETFVLDLLMTTPIQGWKTREININGRSLDKYYTFNTDFLTERGKILDLMCNSTMIKDRSQLHCNIVTPTSKMMQTGKLDFKIHYLPKIQKFQCRLFADQEIKLNMSGSFVGYDFRNFESNIEVESHFTSFYRGYIRDKMNKMLNQLEMAILKDSQGKFSGRISTNSNRSDYNGELEVKNEGKRVIFIDAKCEENPLKKHCYLNFTGAITPIVVTLSYRNENSLIKPLLNICWKHKVRNFECIEIDTTVKFYHDRYYHSFTREFKFKLKTPRTDNLTFEFVNNGNGEIYDNRIILATPRKKIGYETHLDLHLPTKICKVQIYLPSRVMKARGNFAVKKEVYVFAELLLDAERQPTKKFTLDMFHKNNLTGSNPQIISRIKLNYPDHPKPISAVFELNRNQVGLLQLVHTKFLIDYSKDSRDKIVCIVDLTVFPKQKGYDSFFFNLYKPECTYLNLEINSHLVLTREKYSCGLHWNFLPKHNESYSGFSMLVQPLNKTFGISLQRNKNKLEANGRWSFENYNKIKAEVDLQVNDEQQKKLQATIGHPKSCMDIILREGEVDLRYIKNRICVNFTKSDLISSTTSSFPNSKKPTNAFFKSHLNKDIVVESEDDELTLLLKKILERILEVISDLINPPRYILPMMNKVAQDIHRPITGIVLSEFGKLTDELKEDVSAINKTIGNIFDKLPSKEVIKRKLKEIRNYSWELYDKIRHKIIKKYFENTKNYIKKLGSPSKYYGHLKHVFEKREMMALIKEIYNKFIFYMHLLSGGAYRIQ